MPNNIYTALVAINKEVGAIAKGQTNKQQGFKYRGIDDVMTELHDLFAKNDVFITQKVLSEKREERPSKSGGLNIWSIVNYQFTFWASDGSSVNTEMIGEAMDSGDKGNNKSVSVALKYALLNLFIIPTAETKKDDPDASSVEIALSLDGSEIDLINSANEQKELANICRGIEQKRGSKYHKLIVAEFNRRKLELEIK